MSLALQMSAGSGELRVKAKGDFSLPEAQRTFLEMLEVVVEHQADKVLFDGRAIEGNPKVIERFYYAQFAALAVTDHVARGVCSSPKFAYVLEKPLLDPRRFGEDVANNRGMRVKVFDDLHEASVWLGIASASQDT